VSASETTPRAGSAALFDRGGKRTLATESAEKDKESPAIPANAGIQFVRQKWIAGVAPGGLNRKRSKVPDGMRMFLPHPRANRHGNTRDSV
jgi:hypothetical protein